MWDAIKHFPPLAQQVHSPLQWSVFKHYYPPFFLSLRKLADELRTIIGPFVNILDWGSQHDLGTCQKCKPSGLTYRIHWLPGRAWAPGSHKPSGDYAQEAESLQLLTKTVCVAEAGERADLRGFTRFAHGEPLGASMHLAVGTVAWDLSGVAGPSENSKGFQMQTFLHSLKRKPKESHRTIKGIKTKTWGMFCTPAMSDCWTSTVMPSGWPASCPPEDRK